MTRSDQHLATEQPKPQLSDKAAGRIQYFLTAHFRDGRELYTAETGGGPATPLFARYARHHAVYCDSRPDLPDLETWSKRPDNVRFVIGATHRTLRSDAPPQPLDIVLISGRHAYPIPDMEFFEFWPMLKGDGIIILADVRVPTTRNLFDFLCQEESTRHHSTVDGVAFFIRVSDRSPGDIFEDWRYQRYNRISYPALKPTDHSIGISLPLEIKFDGSLRTLPSFFRSGFALLDGKPATEGRDSIVVIVLDREVSGDIEVALDVDVVGWRERTTCRMKVFSAGHSASWELSGELSHRIRLRMEVRETRSLYIMIRGEDFVPARSLRSLAGADIDGSYLANVVITGITVRLMQNVVAPVREPAVIRDGAIAEFEDSGSRFRFFVTNSSDSIQAYHAAGQIYEREELALIARNVRPAGSRVLDIGANIGNHAIWFEKAMKAARVVVIEPQQSMIELLRINCILNEVRNVDQSRLGVAFSKEEGLGRIDISDDFNPAGGSLLFDNSGTIHVITGDVALAGESFDLIKIDVEGAEIDVLTGLRELLARCKPTIFVEVWDKQRAMFLAYVDSIGYQPVDEYRRYHICSNLLLKPKPHLDRASQYVP